jgi:hypothetical protein
MNRLLREATYYAIQWQQAKLESLGNCNDREAVRTRQETRKSIQEIKAYRLKRWGIPLDSDSYK